MQIRGKTPEIRAAARRLRATYNRADFYRTRVRSADGPHRKLELVLDWIAAIANDLAPDDAAKLTKATSDLAAQWNARTGT